MRTELRHRIIALLLTVAVFFPFVVQASHAFEQHKHEICISKDIQHFHNLKDDCKIFHTPVDNGTFTLDFFAESEKLFDFQRPVEFRSNLYALIKYKTNLTRGPPQVLFH